MRAQARRDPVCEWVERDESGSWQRCDREAVHVHHIDGLGCRGPRGYDMGNLQALCPQHTLAAGAVALVLGGVDLVRNVFLTTLCNLCLQVGGGMPVPALVA